MSFLAELRRRNVIRVAGLYVVAAWLVVQVAETVLPIFATPEWVLRTLVVMLAIGFVPALIFSWVFELTPEGIKRERDIRRDESIVDHTARKLDVAVIVLLVGVAALVLWKPGQRAETPEGVATAETGAAADEPLPSPEVPVPLREPSTSIAVLPFVNMSSDPEQVYFSDGIAEELLNALVKLPDLKVAGRTSSFAFRDQTGDLREIGRALNVNHILEGSVRKQGDRIRITAQLVTAEDGFHLWSETYDREAGDIFALQDEITAAIVGALKVKLGGEVAPRAERIDLAAYERYLKARQQMALRGVEALQVSRRLFGEVVALAPDYAPAHAGLARSLTLLATYASTDLTTEAVPSDLEVQRVAGLSARRALELDPENAEAWSVLGYVAWLYSGDLDLAEEATTRSLALSPRDPEIVNFAGDYFFWVLDPRSEATERLAVELDPLQAANHHDLARLLIFEERYAEALDAAQTAQALGFYRRSPALLTDTVLPGLIGVGRFDEAQALIDSARRSGGLSEGMAIFMQARLLVGQGDQQAASALLDTLIKEDAPSVLGYYVVDGLLRLGRLDEAAVWLERALSGKDRLLMDPLYLPMPERLPEHAGLRSLLDRPSLRRLFEMRRQNLQAKEGASA
ncbi:hypothetical protein [Pseudomarimonas salicorniae]|uniref:TolB amino-terminal domain-containing protein n=1 Tax=Pseudomarimonas salicorniae TaxID=2933270 RepID=A0ABT0GDV5_9GAMM|nr:hypothetical protein [Lysobacter sp. CAU 1642]MCK7592734.1 hypothetical protein [Lysobacter sp. CAU 1642]